MSIEMYFISVIIDTIFCPFYVLTKYMAALFILVTKKYNKYIHCRSITNCTYNVQTMHIKLQDWTIHPG